MKRICFLLLVFFPLFLCAQKKQGQALIDSLLPKLPDAKEDTLKANILDNLSYAYYRIDPDKGIEYGKQGLQLAERLNWKTGIGKIYSALGANYFVKSAYPIALDYWLKALDNFEELGDKENQAKNLLNIGRIYFVQKNSNKALEYYFKALALNEALNDKNSIPHNLEEIGSAYLAQNNLPEALEYYNKALAINTELGNKAGVADNTGNMGIIYFNQSDFARTLQCFFIGLRMNEELGDKSNMIFNLGNIGDCYLAIAKDTTGKIKTDSLIPTGKAANLHKAIEYFNKCITLCKETGDLNDLQNYGLDLSEAEALTGNYKDALETYKQFVAAKDSVFNTENNVKITNLETKRELQVKDKQIEIDKLAVEKKRNERWFYITGIGLILVVTGIIYRNYKRQIATNVLLSQEKQKSEDLLLNILPEEVAAELKEKGTSTARHFEHVTVMFTDFVNFTQAGERMSPQELIDELHTCFKAFDEIINKYDIEKIKTIGDAYLAVSGLPTADPKHAEHAVMAAIEINIFMQARLAKLGTNTFSVRIGIHSGSVVAGIVGVTKFAYDIWGDTVNTAARMEQNSEPGKINISQTTYELVKDKITCDYRGEIDAKGKGQLKMYFVS